jgi:hypothetical protein
MAMTTRSVRRRRGGRSRGRRGGWRVGEEVAGVARSRGAAAGEFPSL